MLFDPNDRASIIKDGIYKATFSKYESFLDNKANTLVRNPNLDVIEFWLNKGVDIVDKRGFRGFVLNLPLELIIFPRGYATCAVRK